MCGIVAQLNIEAPITRPVFEAMRDTLLHRGPDDQGMEVLEDGKVALGHRRLSIIDLSKAGRQPMPNEDGTIWLTFNGEIYNFHELKKTLEIHSHTFRSATDSEVIIHGYEEWGIEGLLQKLKGMFAFGIWDANKKKFFIARDRFGIKPLYYTQTRGSFIMASEIKAIIKNPDVSTSISTEALADFLVYRFIPSPKTVYKEVCKLPPAHYLAFDYSNWNAHTNCYWNPEFSQTRVSQAEIQERVEHLLENSVKCHLISDVPIGVFLSGGYDSSALVHYMNKLSYSTETFTIGFSEWEKTEHKDAHLIADLYETDHREKILPSSLGQDLSAYMHYYDEPLGGSSFMPTFEISKMASERVKVVLGGDGGDELFAGYRWHYELAEKADTLKGRFRGLAEGKDQLLRQYWQKMSWAGYGYGQAYNMLGCNVAHKELPDDIWLYRLHDRPEWPTIKRLQWLDIKTFLPEVICTKVDRASMAHSLEVRVPFLDHELFEFVLSLKPSAYFKKGVKKKLLYNMLKPHVPEDILNKKKQGFGAPKAKINYRSMLEGGLLMEKQIVDKEIFLEYLRSENQYKLWPLYILENWFRAWQP